MSFWSVVQTESQREHVAAQFLAQAHFETYCPKILSKQGTRERVVPLFPGYLFVAIADHWYEIRWTIGVLRLLTIDGEPAKVPDRALSAIRKNENRNGLVVLPKPRGLLCGDRIRVKRGLFEGRTGVYQGLSGTQRSKILLQLLGREVATVIKTCDVEPVVASCGE